MRYFILTFSTFAALAAAVPAHAGACGAKPCTAEQINKSLQWLGRPEHEQIGHSRVISDDDAAAKGETRSTTTSTTTVRTK